MERARGIIFCGADAPRRPPVGCMASTANPAITDDMKLQHTTALALAGWFLMAPPTYLGTNGSYVARTGAPLRLWQNIGSYDSVSECEEERHAFLDLKKSESTSALGQESKEAKPMIVASWSAVCVPSDDSRLEDDQ
jgi:hypothetical protein